MKLASPARRPNPRAVRAYPAIKSSMTLEGILLLTFPVSQIELGTACGKLFRCSSMAVLEAGDSDILSGQTA
jgi:ribosomal protein L30E